MSPDLQPSPDQLVQTLQALGLTDLEARIYIHLLGGSPATGYGVAKALGKPAANIYQAISSLQRKGVILVEEGDRRLCRAVPHRDMIGRLSRGYQDRCRRASEALATVQRLERDDGVYQLRSRQQVLDRFESMMERVEKHVIIDAWPANLPELVAPIEAAVARGISITVKTYEPTEIAGAEVVHDYRGLDHMTAYPGGWLNVVIDGGELLLAHLASDQVNLHLAVWTDSPNIAWTYYGGITAELLVDLLFGMLREGKSAEEILRVVEDRRVTVGRDLPGYRELLRRCGVAIEGGDEECPSDR
jgi:HTH-type transcriptional regulator, sugar sensing transcriptional regulator